MLEELIKVHATLHPHILQLHIRWAQFRYLFTDSDKRMAVLFDAAPGFFAIIRDVLRDDAFISLSRLTDPAKSKVGKNLTLDSLMELAKSAGINELLVSAQPLFDQICEEVKNMRKWRNKSLAHTDYNHAFLDKVPPEYSVQRGNVDHAISATIQLMNLFARYLQRPLLEDGLPIIVGDADVLARLLESLYASDAGT